MANARSTSGPVSRFLSEFPADRCRAQSAVANTYAGASGWGPSEIADCERMATKTDDPLLRAGYRALARVMSALFTTHGRAWGTPDLIRSIATDMACNTHGSDVIGWAIEPMLRQARRYRGLWAPSQAGAAGRHQHQGPVRLG